MRREARRKKVVEEPDDHTNIKRAILEGYLGAWLSILGQGGFPSVWYVDCCAGPGIGDDGSPTSGLLSVQQSQSVYEARKVKCANCIVIENDADHYERLRTSIECEDIPTGEFLWCPPLKPEQWLDRVGETTRRDPGVYVYGVEADFQNVLPGLLRQIPALGTPAFFFIDPYGYTDIPFDIVKNILARPTVEIFLTFFAHHIARFGSDERTRETIQRVMGTEEIDSLTQGSLDQREEAILDAYVHNLYQAGARFTCWFRVMRSDMRQTAYYLVHGSKDETALKRMKDVMATNRTPGMGACYGGPDHIQLSQSLRLFKAEKGDLQDLLSEQFTKKTVTYEELELWVYENTPWVSKDLRPALREMRDTGEIEYTAVTSKRNGLKGKDLLSFP